MTKVWINKANSFEKAKTFDAEYYKNLSSTERIEIVQFLREQYFKFNGLNFNENRKRLRRVSRIIKQA